MQELRRITSSSHELTVSVIIPVHNGGSNFRSCLRSIIACSPAPYETIVVADGDTDCSWRMAEQMGMRVVRLPTPGGPAHARNLGAEAAKGDILFFVDADVTIPQDAVGLVRAALQQDPELAAVFGCYDDEPSETSFLSQYKNLFHHYVHQTAKEEASTFWGACGAIRRKIFLAVGGFDEGYRRPSIEDIELGYRLKRAGYRIRLLKALQVKHLKHWGVLSLLKTDFFYRALPWTRLILSEGRFVDDLNTRVSNRISVVFIHILLLVLLAAWSVPWLFFAAAFFVAGLLVLNWDLYRFLGDKRGFGFTLKAIPWHWFYFLYSGLAFSIGFANHRIKRLRS